MHKVKKKNLMNKRKGELNSAPTGPFHTDSFQTLNGTYGSLQGHRFLVWSGLTGCLSWARCGVWMTQQEKKNQTSVTSAFQQWFVSWTWTTGADRQADGKLAERIWFQAWFWPHVPVQYKTLSSYLWSLTFDTPWALKRKGLLVCLVFSDVSCWCFLGRRCHVSRSRWSMIYGTFKGQLVMQM